MSKVSVVVPIYNAGRKLEKCIKSIINQTYKEFELILVNDGSTDNSLNICEKFQKRDNRIIIIDKKNEGSVAARRTGVKASSSKYTMFVDADDWIDRKTIEILYNESNESSVDITVCNMYKVIGRSCLIKQKNNSVYFNEDKIYNKEEIRRELVVAYFHGHPFPPSLCAKIYKKELLVEYGNFLDRIRFLGDDLFYNLEMFLKASKVKVINKPLYYYRHGGGTSKYMPYFFDDVINGYQIQKEVIDEYYLDTQQNEFNGISIVLLNMFKSGLHNLFDSELSESEIKDLIRKYVSNENIIECIDNEGAVKCLSEEYLNAIRNNDIQYLYQLGENMYKSRKVKKVLLSIASSII